MCICREQLTWGSECRDATRGRRARRTVGRRAGSASDTTNLHARKPTRPPRIHAREWFRARGERLGEPRGLAGTFRDTFGTLHDQPYRGKSFTGVFSGVLVAVVGFRCTRPRGAYRLATSDAVHLDRRTEGGAGDRSGRHPETWCPEEIGLRVGSQRRNRQVGHGEGFGEKLGLTTSVAVVDVTHRR